MLKREQKKDALIISFQHYSGHDLRSHCTGARGTTVS